MQNGASPFVWYELMTADAAEAAKFYSTVIGWTAKDAGVPGMSYTLFDAPGEVKDCAIAGMMALSDMPGADGAKSGWLGYIGVADADAMAAKVAEAGGTIIRPADDIPGVGRFAIVTDPQGAVFALFQPSEMPESPPDFGSRKPGYPGWRELYAKDGEAAFAFYEKLFGWTLSRDFDMGAMGKYKVFGVNGTDAGGIMTAPPQAPQGWGFYFMVDGINAAAERVKSQGGTVIFGPTEVPNGEWIINCHDPKGVAFSLVSPKQ